ncbi:MAG: hypothetical protein NTX70_12175 [Verrucomicrobia bacterium]|nr:hypothetical protein [Verrucomicrobiota bacterium]
MGFLVEGVLAAAQHEQTFFHEAEVELGQGRQFFERRPAGQADVPQQRRGLLDPLGRAGLPEAPSPLEELRIEAGTNLPKEQPLRAGEFRSMTVTE